MNENKAIKIIKICKKIIFIEKFLQGKKNENKKININYNKRNLILDIKKFHFHIHNFYFVNFECYFVFLHALYLYLYNNCFFNYHK